MATPAQGAQQAVLDGFQRAQQRKQELEDEQRKVTLKTLQEDAETPEDKVAAIQAVYHKDPGVLKQHVENLTRKLTGKQPQPVVDPQQAQQQRIAPIVARGKTPAQQGLSQQQASGDIANQQILSLQQQEAVQKQQQTFALIDQYVKDPEQNRKVKQDYVSKQAGVLGPRTLKEFSSPDGQQRNWFTPGEEPPGWNATQGATKPGKPLYKVIRNHAVLIDPNTGQVLHDLGLASLARTTTRDVPITDANGTVHIERMTSVSVPGSGNVDVQMAPDAGAPEASPASPKGPAPRKAPAHASPQPKGGGRTLDFQKATTAGNKARTDFVEATKLNSIAQQVSQHPDDAINQKRLAVALERASAGRFTVQALDYIIKSGWGNTIEQWANNPSTGALPKDVVRQLVDGASQNLKASRDAIDAVDDLGSKGTPAPKKATGGDRKVGEVKKFPNGKTGVWDGTGWVAQ